jgi:hypothetical protein
LVYEEGCALSRAGPLHNRQPVLSAFPKPAFLPPLSGINWLGHQQGQAGSLFNAHAAFHRGDFFRGRQGVWPMNDRLSWNDGKLSGRPAVP